MAQTTPPCSLGLRQGWLYLVWVLQWRGYLDPRSGGTLLSSIPKVGTCALALGLPEMRGEGMFVEVGTPGPGVTIEAGWYREASPFISRW